MKTRIGILGLGGVGGFVGGQLAEKYTGSATIEVIFITRPASEKIIQEKGLKLIIAEKEKTINPDIVSSDPNRIGQLDLLICATKSYDLEESLVPLKTCITENTIILPLLNGVDAAGRIEAMYPMAEVVQGCIYIVSRILEPGVVKVTGNSHALYFGSGDISIKKLDRLQDILIMAGINSYLFGNIHQTIWEKFLFISAIASMTSYLDKPLGEILENMESKDMLTQLLQEFIEVAKAHHVNFDADIFEKTLLRMEKLPYETTSSMHNDFKKGGRTEYRSLTGYVVDLGDQYGIETKMYDKVLAVLKRRDPSGASG